MPMAVAAAFWHAFRPGARPGAEPRIEEMPVKRFVLGLLCAVLGACAAPPPLLSPPSPAPLLRDELFAAPSEPIDASQVFALSDAMRRYLQVDIGRQLRTEGPALGLFNALYRRDQLKLDYEAAWTRNASQAFEARRGNCLSLVIMTAAFAKELGLEVTYQAVDTDDIWSRSDDLAFLNNHVNLRLGPPPLMSRRYDVDTRTFRIDFLPAREMLGQRTREITEDTVVAMYMNNRAAEALAAGRIDDAYGWARAAVMRAPDFSIAYNTLGVVYLRHGALSAAEAVFGQLLEREPRDRQALSNLATVLDKRGRHDESRALRERLAQLEPEPPYHFFQLGLAAMQRGDHDAARRLFVKEVDRADYNSEFQFWLGLAHLRLGDVAEARRRFGIALRNSTTRADHDLYAAKLDRLRAHEAR
jgi:tetratricopeptide (TPR) repeat protein